MFKPKFILIAVIVFFKITLSSQTSCPPISGFNFGNSLPNPCIKTKTYSYLYNNLGQPFNATYNFGDGSPIATYTYSSLQQLNLLTSSHSYTSAGIYTVSLTVNGPGTCASTITKTVSASVGCSSCNTYSNLSTGFDRLNNIPFAANEGNFDPYWYVVKKQNIASPTFTPIPGTEIYYTGVLAYDVVPNGGYITSLTSGDAKYISMNSTMISQGPQPNLVTYRTYFNMPSPLPTNKSYSLALSLRADDGIYQVSLNGTDIKSPGYGPTGGSYQGDELILSVNSCSNSALISGANYIEIVVADTYLAATQLTAEILLYECSTTCAPPPPCSDCISSFSPIPGKKYLVSAWVKEKNAPQSKTSYTNPSLTILFPSISGSVGPFTASGVIIDGWQRVEGEFLIPASATNMSIKLDCISGDCYYDDVRVLPFDGSMKSYVYDPVTMRLVAELDERNYATLYEYDEEGKLIRVKKETEKGKMTIQENRNNTKK